MVFYFINIVLIIGWSFILLKNKPSDKKKKIYCGIVALQWIVLSGLRDWSIGADTYAYYIAFERDKSLSWSQILTRCWDYLFNDLVTKDPGYYLLQKIFQVFSDDYQVFLIFIAVLFTGLMARWIYKYSSMPELSFIIYSTLFYSFYAVTGHRQTIATALIVFIGYELAQKKKFLQFAIVAFVAYMIHKSSVVFILFAIIANINLSFIYVVVMSGAILLVSLLGIRLYGPVALALGFEEEALDSVGGANTYALVLLIFCLITFCLYPWISKNRLDAKNLYNMTFLTTASTLLIFQHQGFMRIQQYYSLIIMITAPEIILSVEKKYRTFVYWAMIAVLVAHLLRSGAKYEFFFM